MHLYHLLCEAPWAQYLRFYSEISPPLSCQSHNKKWVHPDLFALYISATGDDIATKENLANFAKKFQVGLVYIVRRNAAVLFDPISGKIVGQKNMSGLPKEGKFPFYMRFKDIDSGWWFGSDVKGNYYNTIESI